MDVSVDHHSQCLIVSINGRLDTLTAPQFDSQLAPLLAAPKPRILLDLAGVSYISSAGLRSILQLVKHTGAHGGRLGLVAVTPQVHEVIEISGFPSLLDLYPDRATAVAAQPC